MRQKSVMIDLIKVYTFNKKMYLTEGKFWYYFFSIHETILENWRNKSKTSAQFNEQQINCNFIFFLSCIAFQPADSKISD